jgi:hypothetical protein
VSGRSFAWETARREPSRLIGTGSRPTSHRGGRSSRAYQCGSIALAVAVAPGGGRPRGMGLALARRVCDEVEIRTGGGGTTVRLRMSPSGTARPSAMRCRSLFPGRAGPAAGLPVAGRTARGVTSGLKAVEIRRLVQTPPCCWNRKAPP